MSDSSDFGNGFRRPTGTAPNAVAAFAAAWEADAQPPAIADYLPAAQLGALLELIRIDLRHRWLRRPAGIGESTIAPRPKRLREYFVEFPELTPEKIPAALVYEEFLIRRHSGEPVDPRACLREYPEQAAQLRVLLAADDNGDHTTGPGPEPEVTPSSMTSSWTTTRPATGLLTSPGTPTTGATGLDRIAVGDRIDDFDLLTELGSGAFARVFLARQRSLQRLVAVKISADRGTEPQTLAQLDHDYIVRIFDQCLLDEQGSGSAPGAHRLRLLYMQFLPGGTLMNVLRWVRATPPGQRGGALLLEAVDTAMAEKGEIRPTDSTVRAQIAALSWPETVAWLGRRLAEALAYADAHGVLHRDVKPANVLLTAEAVPKLADFNISFNRDLADADPLAYFGGSLSYMSPEQLEACLPRGEGRAEELDTRADIYSLGVLLWELLTGAKPFDDTAADESLVGTLTAMVRRRRAGVDPRALERLPADCPAALRRVLLTCLRAEREQRWAGGAELAQQLEVCLDERARDLVDPPSSSWRLRLRPWLVPLLTLAVVIPNAVASAYNIQHGRTLIIERLSVSSQHVWWIAVTVVNGVSFPLGLGLVLYLSRCVLIVSRGLRRGRIYDPRMLALARSDALRFGERTVLVAFSLWSLAAITFPIAIHFTTAEFTGELFLHFLGGVLVFGAMAVAYPFFLVTFYLVRCIYPMFLRHGDIGSDEALRLRGLARRCTVYLTVAASVPLLAIVGVTLLPPADIPLLLAAMRVLCVGAIIAFIVVYVLFRALEADLRALERVVAPVGRPGQPNAAGRSGWLGLSGAPAGPAGRR
ncbi:serine/threonine-protein kinase [Nocardia sp. NPDC019255]|uniref:serine/threonine-protein kinase n=1 Tax=Nocardia sp. NPDC019255 TaxID=3154591 RepID=UPI0033FFEC5F